MQIQRFLLFVATGSTEFFSAPYQRQISAVSLELLRLNQNFLWWFLAARHNLRALTQKLPKRDFRGHVSETDMKKLDEFRDNGRRWLVTVSFKFSAELSSSMPREIDR